jgi:circadian clock protein KaiC
MRTTLLDAKDGNGNGFLGQNRLKKISSRMDCKTSRRERKDAKRAILPRASTGIRGLDEITRGGLPRGASTLVCGPAGTGKTIFGIEFIVRGAAELDEPGIYLSFEESKEKILRNICSLGFDGETLINQNKIYVDHIEVAPENDAEVGSFDLSGLFMRLDRAIARVKAKRVVVDGVEALVGAFNNQHLVRQELGRLFRRLDAKGVTSVVTGEKGDGVLTRHGLEEYLADCVIFLDHRISDQLSTRRLRVVKYRGAPHSTDEFPFLIDEDGICVFPLTSLGLNHTASEQRISTGIKRLDELFGGQGFFRGSSILVSGTAGTGKSSIAATFIDAACARGEHAIYFAFEESQDQIIRNMKSIGLELGRWAKRGLLRFETFRPTVFGLEPHLANIQRIVLAHKPRVVVIDPLTNFTSLGSPSEVKNMLMRLIDLLKTHQITALFTSLTEGGAPVEQSSVGVSSLIDTWLLVRDIEMAGERNRGLYILKSRGMAHSNQIREFVITDRGLDLVPVYVGVSGNIFIGAARAAKKSEEEAAARMAPEIARIRRNTGRRRRKAFEAELLAMRAKFEAEQNEQGAAQLREERRERRAARLAEEAHRALVPNDFLRQ